MECCTWHTDAKLCALFCPLLLCTSYWSHFWTNLCCCPFSEVQNQTTGMLSLGFISWCDNPLYLNVSKTKERIIDFRCNREAAKCIIPNESVEMFTSCNIFGYFFDDHLHLMWILRLLWSEATENSLFLTLCVRPVSLCHFYQSFYWESSEFFFYLLASQPHSKRQKQPEQHG